MSAVAVLNKSDIPQEGTQRRIPPCRRLADLVESFWVQDAGPVSGPRRVTRVLPTGTVEILFHHGDLLVHQRARGHEVMPRSYVTGQRTRPVQVFGTGRTRWVIASLYPWGLERLFPGAVEAPDGYTDLALISPAARIERLEERLALAPGTTARVRLVEAFLVQARAPSIDPEMALAAQLLNRTGIHRPVSAASHALGLSERHFFRRFKACIGVRPSVFWRITRFQRALCLRRARRLPWAGVAAECGYSDQAHLIRDMHEFAGQTPGEVTLDSGPGKSGFNGEGASEYFDTVYL